MNAGRATTKTCDPLAWEVGSLLTRPVLRECRYYAVFLVSQEGPLPLCWQCVHPVGSLAPEAVKTTERPPRELAPGSWDTAKLQRARAATSLKALRVGALQCRRWLPQHACEWEPIMGASLADISGVHIARPRGATNNEVGDGVPAARRRVVGHYPKEARPDDVIRRFWHHDSAHPTRW